VQRFRGLDGFKSHAGFRGNHHHHGARCSPMASVSNNGLRSLPVGVSGCRQDEFTAYWPGQGDAIDASEPGTRQNTPGITR
jgi:hypothetical protein